MLKKLDLRQSLKIITIFILISFCACAHKRYKNLHLNLEYKNIKQLQGHSVTKRLRHSFNDYLKDKNFLIPRIENIPTPNQLLLLKEKFLVLEIKEEEFNYYGYHLKKGDNSSYDALVSNLYENVYITILISPKEMTLWQMRLSPIGIIGYQIDKIEIFELNNAQKKELEAFYLSENLKYWH